MSHDVVARPESAAEDPAIRGRRRLPAPLTSIALIAAVLFGLGSVGSPLLGARIYGPTDELVTLSPYYQAGYYNTAVANAFLDDIYTSQLPNEQIYGESVRSGHPAGWDPYVSGGAPLGSVPSFALWSPVSWPYLLLPAWLAPAYGKVLEVLCAIAGTYLFLRRVKVGAAAALVGGTIYASNGFLDMWIGFPQTRVAVFIPWVFWAAERLVTRRTATDVVLLAIPVAGMILGGFPAVTALALLTAGLYFLVRIAAEYRDRIGTALKLVGAGVVAAIAGIGLTAAQLLPFVGFYPSFLIENRTQGSASHLDVAALVTTFAPFAFGGPSFRSDRPFWYLPPINIVETMSYVGAAAVVLVVVAVALARSGRSLLPRAVWVFLVASAAGWIVAIYLNGPMHVLQHLPIFSFNFIGRARSVLFFSIAALAAVGFELVLRGRGSNRSWNRARLGSLLVWVAAGFSLVYLVHRARSAAAHAPRGYVPAGMSAIHYANVQMLTGLLLMAAMFAVLAWLYFGPQRRAALRIGAAGLVPIVVAVQALTFVVPISPRAERKTFYPITDVQQYLLANLGSDRFAGTDNAMPFGADIVHRLRSISGHAFINDNLATMLRAMPEDPIPFETYIYFKPQADVAQSPILDRLATKYFITSPDDPVFGSPHANNGDGSATTIAPDQSFTVDLGAVGPLRAVGITPQAPVPGVVNPQWYVTVTVTNAGTGAVVAQGKRLTVGRQGVGLVPGRPFYIPVAADTVPAGTHLTASVTLHTAGPAQLAAAGSGVAVSTVGSADDGLSLVHAGSSIVYQRTHALPRIRWASSTVVQPDEKARLSLLRSGSLRSDQVVLNAPGPAADGRPATVAVASDGTDEIRTTVDAQGAGYLVVADADQVGWRATVDGKDAPLVAADQGVVAIPVPAGTHTVALHFAAPHGTLGAVISIVTLFMLLGVLGWSGWRMRTRRP
jgi:hypothetical protein